MDSLLAGLPFAVLGRRTVVVVTLLFFQLLASAPSAAQTWFTDPSILDRRDGFGISFPGGGYRSTESVVPWIE